MRKIFISLMLVLTVLGCGLRKKEQTENIKQINVPTFNADSAYNYVQTQVNFGARVPNTTAHKQCAQYLSTKLKIFGASVTEQKALLTAFDGTKLEAINIIGSYNPTAKQRVMLFAHWDSRPWADNDPNPSNHNKPVMGANDGASGVGVLLEIARQLNTQQTNIGVDIMFFDAEDYGAPHWATGDTEDSWCLGTQYWCANLHTPNYQANFGILLDMVGAPNATFYKEQYSMQYASEIVNKVWSTAQSLGFSNYFKNDPTGAITDDHYYVNKLLGIPSIDIIQYRNEGQNSGFGHYWHTVNDTMDNVDKNTLHAVGTTVMHVIYNE